MRKLFTYFFSISFLLFSFLLTDYFIVIVHLFIFYFFVSFLLIMTFDLKAQPASISSAICGLRRIIIVFSSLTNKMEWKWNGKLTINHFLLIKRAIGLNCAHYRNRRVIRKEFFFSIEHIPPSSTHVWPHACHVTCMKFFL